MDNNDYNIKDKIRERYSKIAVFGNSDSCCMPSSECCGGGKFRFVGNAVH
jgi:hypothetical protein